MKLIKNTLIGLALPLLFINSCKKDTTDFNKFDKYVPSPEFAVPLINTRISMENYVKSDSVNINVDNAKLIHFVYRKDSLFEYNLSDVFEFENNNTTELNNSLGVLAINNVENTKLVTLQELTANFSPSAKAAFDLIAGTNNIFPAITENISTVNNFNAFPDFSSITFSDGWLILKITNKLPVNISALKLNLYNTSPSQLFLGDFDYLDIAPGTSKSDSISLIDKTLSASLGYTLPVLNTNSSAPTAVLINYQDSIVIKAIGKNLKAYKGVGTFPSQNITNQTTVIDFTPPDTTQRVRKLNLATGKIKIEAESTISEPIELTINFPGATKNGLPLANQVITIPNTGIGNSIIDSSINIGGIDFDLTQNINKPYNYIPITYSAKIISSNQPVAFDSSNHLKLKINTSKLQLEYMEGYVGTIEIKATNDNNIDLKFLEIIKGNLGLNGAELKLKIRNSIGVPIQFNYNFIGKNNNNGLSQDAQLMPFDANFPAISEAGQTKLTTQIYSNKNNNGKIDELMSLPPHNIKVEGKALTNVIKDPSKNQFVKKGSGIGIGVELDLPLAIKADSFTLKDTSNFDLKSLDKVSKITLGLNIENSFPFDAKLKLVFYNSITHTAVDSITGINLVLSAITDNDGKTIQTTKARNEFTITDALLKKLTDNKVDKVISTASLVTENGGSKIVKMYSDYYMNISIGVLAKIKQ